jgi:hypothetical protein
MSLGRLRFGMALVCHVGVRDASSLSPRCRDQHSPSCARGFLGDSGVLIDRAFHNAHDPKTDISQI